MRFFVCYPLFQIVILLTQCSVETFAFSSSSIPSQIWHSCPASLYSDSKSYEGAFGSGASIGAHHRLLGRKKNHGSLMMSSSAMMEKLMEKLPSEKVIEAIEKSRSNQVVASDVAASAGVSLSQARRDLTALASISQGDIAVSSDGELIYTFPKNLNGVLSERSSKFKAQQVFQKVWPSLFWVIRISFGVALLASVLAIFSTIFFISQGSSDDRDDRRDSRGGGGGGNMGFFFGPSPFDFFYYRPYGYYGYYGVDGGYSAGRDPDDMGFLESIFSYIFGDGDPNVDLEQKRLKLAAQMIRENGGAVTAEQLAPFSDDAPNPTEDESGYVDESFVLPIVTQLNGEPSVTEDGDIVYLFPELQQTSSKSRSSVSKSSLSDEDFLLKRAGLKPDTSTGDISRFLNYNGISTRGAYERPEVLQILKSALGPMTEKEKEELEAEMSLNDPSVLQEREFKFTLANDFNKFLAGGLGVVNLGGALYLGNLLGKLSLVGVRLPAYYGVVQAFFPALLGYAILYNVIPAARSFWIGRKNNQIRERNSIRRRWKNALTNGFGKTARKLKAAKAMGMKMKQLGGKDDIIFDTGASMEENTQRKQQNDLDEFDKLLNDSKN